VLGWLRFHRATRLRILIASVSARLTFSSSRDTVPCDVAKPQMVRCKGGKENEHAEGLALAAAAQAGHTLVNGVALVLDAHHRRLDAGLSDARLLTRREPNSHGEPT
jgi:hypothetical protein